jgi:F-type H+-transporting ATPase subunit epsilon
MAHAKFKVEVLTPEGEVWGEEVEMLSTRTTSGSIGVLAHHAPLLAMLEPAELRLYKTESDVVRFAQAEGYMQVTSEHVLVLVEEAHAPGDLDAGLLRERVLEAERELTQAADDTEKQRVAERNKRRWEEFLRIAEGA